MTIYKYTMKKYIKSYSTWMIIAIAMVIAFIGGYLPFKYLQTDSFNSSTEYAFVITATVSGVTSLSSVFISVFAGFKSAQMFKDEVEDGTFLVMLSKPVTRRKLILSKWLALQTAMIFFGFIIALTFGITASIFDNAKKIDSLAIIGIDSLRSKIFVVGSIMWGLFVLVGLIFSSIALLLSTKVTTGATIGISIGLGVIIPITGIVGLFTKKEEYKSFYTPNIISMRGMINRFENEESDFPSEQATLIKALTGDFTTNFKNWYGDLIGSKESLYNLGVSTGKTNGFQHLWPFDLQYQIAQMSSMASEKVIPPFARELTTHNAQGDQTKNIIPLSGVKLSSINILIEKLKETLNNPNLIKMRKSYYAMIQNAFNMLSLSAKSDVDNKLDAITGLTMHKNTLAEIIRNLFFAKQYGILTENDFSDEMETKMYDTYFQHFGKGRDVDEITENAIKNIFKDSQNVNPSTTSAPSKTIKGIFMSKVAPTSIVNGSDTNHASFKMTFTDSLNIMNLWLKYCSTSFEHASASNNLWPEAQANISSIQTIIQDNPYDRMKVRDMFNGNGEIEPENEYSSNSVNVFSWLFSGWKIKLSDQSKADNNVMMTKEVMTIMKKINASLYDVLSYLVIDRAKAEEFIRKNNIDDLSGDALKIFNDNHLFSDVNNPLSSLSPSDRRLFEDLLTIIANGKDNVIVKVKSVDYVNKYYLLLGYFLLAIALVPLSYLLIRKQDFR